MPADAQVNLDKSTVDQYSALTEFKQVKAPFDGTITERKIGHRQPGDGRQHHVYHASVSHGADRTPAHFRRRAAERRRRADE